MRQTLVQLVRGDIRNPLWSLVTAEQGGFLMQFASKGGYLEKYGRLLAIVLSLAGTATDTLATGARKDRVRPEWEIAEHAALHIDFWGMDWAARALTERVRPAPEKWPRATLRRLRPLTGKGRGPCWHR